MRPERVFLFRLAATLGWSVQQVERDISSRELSEWKAVDRYYMRLPDPWEQTGVLAAAVVAPHFQKGQRPKASAVVGLKEPPRHPLQVRAALADFAAELEGW